MSYPRPRQSEKPNEFIARFMSADSAREKWPHSGERLKSAKEIWAKKLVKEEAEISPERTS